MYIITVEQREKGCLNMLQQKLGGIIIMIASLMPAILNMDAGAFVLLFPLGLYLFLTKKQVMF